MPEERDASISPRFMDVPAITRGSATARGNSSREGSIPRFQRTPLHLAHGSVSLRGGKHGKARAGKQHVTVVDHPSSARSSHHFPWAV